MAATSNLAFELTEQGVLPDLLVRRGIQRLLKQRLQEIQADDTMASGDRQRAFVERFVSLPFDDRAAEFYAETRAALEHRGTPIGANDLMIAAIALANGLVLVTHNVAEFSRVSKLRIEDWEPD